MTLELKDPVDHELNRKLAKVVAPPPNFTVSQWADEERRLSPESSAEPGRWNTDRAPYQRGIMDSLNEQGVHTIVVMSSAQVGKALALDTPIPTKTGWKMMGEIEIGDELFAENGEPCRVTYISPIMHQRPCFEVIFSDGQRVVADAEHRWSVESDTPLSPGFQWHGRGPTKGIRTTEQLRASLRYGKREHRTRYAIPVTKPLQLDPAELLIDPYALGVWLGDGNSGAAQLTCHVKDIEIAEYLREAGIKTVVRRPAAGNVCNIMLDPRDPNPIECIRGHNLNSAGRTTKGYCAECARQHSKAHQYGFRMDPVIERPLSFFQRLRVLGLLKEGKHIPKQYLRGSIEQRYALLQGLMDTDGHITIRGRCEFVTTSSAIADGFADLLASLGHKYTRSIKLPFAVLGERRIPGSKAYRFSFMAYRDTPVFRLCRKRERQVSRGAGRRPTETLRRRIVDINPVESVPVRCIQVDSDSHLFLAGKGMVPTHNTEFHLNIIGYHVHHDPSPILLVQPTLDMAESFSKDRLSPMIRDTPALNGKVKDARSRDANNTLLHKKFPGGHITMAGANSPASLASRPIRIVLCDEVDRYPFSAGTEGDPVKLAQKRSATFFNRISVLVSTPTIAGASRIEQAYEESDQRKYHVPCPLCEKLQPLQWPQIKFDKDERGVPANVRYACIHCGKDFDDSKKDWMLLNGKWIAEAPFRGIAGFHLSELYSPWRRWAETVADFLEAEKNPETLKVWVNTALGETWKQKGDAPEWKRLYERRETYDTNKVPLPVVFLTAGVDVQKDRIEIEVVGWARDKQSWSIDYRVIMGDTATAEPWGKLDSLLTEQWQHENGTYLNLRMLAADSGFNTQHVYNWARRHPMSRVMATKGVDHAQLILGQASVVDVGPKGAKIKRGARVWPIGVSIAKGELYSWLKLDSPLDGQPYPPGYCHFPQYPDEYFQQITAEILVSKLVRGFRRYEWVKTRERNEALDCRILARAAAAACGMDRMTPAQWDALAAAGGQIPSGSPPKGSGPQPERRRRSSFWG